MSRLLEKIAVVVLLITLPVCAQNAPPPPADAPAPPVFPVAPPAPFQATLPPPPPPHAPFLMPGDQTPGILVAPCDNFGLWNNPGIWVGIEGDLVFPDITRFSQFPTSHLDLTLAPTVELGYRFGWGGSILFRYHYLDSSGNSSYTDEMFGPIDVHSRLVNNLWDVDYQSRIYSGAGGWGMQWAVGARLADFEAKSRFTGDGLGDIFARNAFTGAGPHASLTAWRAFGDSGWAAFGSVDGSILFGQGRQNLNLNAPQELIDLVGSSGFEAHGSETAPGLSARVGLSWTRLIGPALIRADGGYVYEEWWLSATGKNSNDALYPRVGWRDQGLFLRLELGF